MINSVTEPNVISFSIPGLDMPLLEFKCNGDVFYNYYGDIKKVENREEILEAFKYCVLGYVNKSTDIALFEVFLRKIDNKELSTKQVIEIEKRIRKLKIEKLK